MDNKEIKTNATELNDDALENVSGGLRTLIETEYDQVLMKCVDCQRYYVFWKARLDEYLIDGQFHCNECKEKLGLS